MIDLAAFRITVLSGDAQGFERGSVGDGDVSIDPHKNGRMIAAIRIDVLATGQSLIGPFSVVPATPNKPFAGIRGLGTGRDSLLHFFQGFGPYQVDVELLKSA